VSKPKPRFVVLATLTALAAAVLAIVGAQSAFSTPRSPLVVISGRVTQLPAGDNVNTAIAAGSGILVDTSHVSVDQSYVQRRVGGCGFGSALQSVDATGTPTCIAAGGGGGGTVTSVGTSAPLAGGPITGAGTISLNTGTGLTTSGGNLIADILTGLTFSGNHIVVDETREQRRVTGACTSPNALDAVNADGTVACTTGVLSTSNVSGTTNTLAKFTGTNTIGNSLVTDNGTTWAINTNKVTVTEASGNTTIGGTSTLNGTTTINATETINVPTASTGETISQTHTNQASGSIGLLYDDTGATHGNAAGSGAGTDIYGVKVNEVAGCAGGVGSCALTANYGVWTSASGASGGGNFALYADQGDVQLNATSGTTTIHGAATLSGGTTISSSSSPALTVTNAATIDTLTVGTSLTSTGTTTVGELAGTPADDSTSTGTVNDYALGSNVTWLRLAPSSTLTVTGITGGVDGRILLVSNVSGAGALLTLSNQSASSAAANRIIGAQGANNIVAAGSTGLMLLYDGNAARWRVVTPNRMNSLTVDGAATLNSGLTVNNTASTFNAQTSFTTGNVSLTSTAHVVSSGTSPTLSTCGTSPTISGGDPAGTIVTGTGATACTATFARTFTTTPTCLVNNRAGGSTPAVTSLSATAITFTAAASATYDYLCVGH
jgi:hypothetical protein